MSTTSWQMGANYHDSNPFLRSGTSNSSYGQHWYSGSSPQTPAIPHYATIGRSSARKIGAYTPSSPDRFSSLTSKDVRDIVSNGDDSKYSSNYLSKYNSNKFAPTSASEYDRLITSESDSALTRRAPLSSDTHEDLGINDLKLSPRAPGGGTLSALNPPPRERSSALPSRRYDFLESRSNGSAYDPLKFGGLEKSRTSLGFSTNTQNETPDNLPAAGSRGSNALERSSSYHGAFPPSPPSKPADSIPTWRSRYHSPGTTTSNHLSERPISSLPGADRPLSINTSLSSDKYGQEETHQPSSPLFPNETSSSPAIKPAPATDYKSELPTAGKTFDYKSSFRPSAGPSRVLSDAEEEMVNNQIAITQTRPMYWLYGSRGRPTTPYKPSSYSYKSEDPLSSSILTSPSRMNESKEVGLGDIPRTEYTRDLVSGLPKQNYFTTFPEPSGGDYPSAYSEYPATQYSPRHGEIRFDASISQPLPPGSPAKRSILKKQSSYGGSAAFYHGIGEEAHLPPLSSSGRKRVSFNSHQTYHPV